MALNLTGISNENEFYTHHYLSAILENDLKDLFAKWSAQEEQSVVGDKPATWRPPYAKLGGLSKLYFVLRNNLEKSRNLPTSRRLSMNSSPRCSMLSAIRARPNSSRSTKALFPSSVKSKRNPARPTSGFWRPSAPSKKPATHSNSTLTPANIRPKASHSSKKKTVSSIRPFPNSSPRTSLLSKNRRAGCWC